MVWTKSPIRPTNPMVLNFVLFFYYLFEGIVLFFIPDSFREKKDVTGKNVLITGGGSGIGQLMALKLAKLGARVIVWDINEDGLEMTKQLFTANKMEQQLHCYQIDIGKRETIYQLAELVRKQVGPIDILINNAGIVTGRALLETPDECIEQSLRINTLSHFYMVKAFLPEMIKRSSGHIVTIASIAGNLSGCNLADYHASKFANVGFDLALRMELAQIQLDSKIKTTIVKPFFINTGMFAGARSRMLPFLEPDHVAERIVDGIRSEQSEIILPWFFWFFFAILVTVPSKCLIPLADAFGVFTMMTQFRGRRNISTNMKTSNNNNNGKLNNE
ncbi:hypothetical protein RDWZM_007844 [Blomia tropicalis]|uniref:Short-chain dehydrogenase/reductase 3 n=1 Tax=Blomia tropicalis TaxID=40697 RepID=A0A9Q0M2E6_BLOTA|nr:hypothetical protein RDWZM_007844 [Blomia tropicalis]